MGSRGAVRSGRALSQIVGSWRSSERLKELVDFEVFRPALATVWRDDLDKKLSHLDL